MVHIHFLKLPQTPAFYVGRKGGLGNLWEVSPICSFCGEAFITK